MEIFGCNVGDVHPIKCSVNGIEPPDWSWWFVTGIWHSYWEYDNFKRGSASISDVGFTTDFNVYLQTQETWLAICESDASISVISIVLQRHKLHICGYIWFVGIFIWFPVSSVIILSVVEAILLLTLIFLRTRIRIAIALIQESSKSVIITQ